jgi:hypothetical protein
VTHKIEIKKILVPTWVIEVDGEVYDHYVSEADAKESLPYVRKELRDAAKRNPKAGPEKLADLFPFG